MQSIEESKSLSINNESEGPDIHEISIFIYKIYR